MEIDGGRWAGCFVSLLWNYIEQNPWDSLFENKSSMAQFNELMFTSSLTDILLLIMFMLYCSTPKIEEYG